MKRSRLPAKAMAHRRVTVEGIRPLVDGGCFAVKRTVGEPITVEADVFADGHDQVTATLRWRHEDDDAWHELPMRDLGNDHFAATFVPTRLGPHWYRVVGMLDRFATWCEDLGKRLAAGQKVEVQLEVGARLIEEVAVATDAPDTADRLARAATRLRAGDLGLLDDAELATTMRAHAPDDDRVTSEKLPLDVDRERARFSTWYEVFPRSTSVRPGCHGTFGDVASMLPYIAGMGFDVLYLPPIHPIGVTNRKGRNNALRATARDVGSPWSIGSEAGGHQAVHPQLGTLDDFRCLLAAAHEHGMEVALDIAFQASPDHPYLRDHPEWFRWQPDGTIQHAENPPKKYEDIVPFDFESRDWAALWRELRSVFEFWIEQGVRVFRVDNPHTKPFAFWEWTLRDLRRRHPDLIFLAEAFTRPRIMERLAKVGFNQSYTYFAWRNSAWELRSYFEELAETDVAEYLRPNVWPNTPDILTEFLQQHGQPAFVIRAILAATLAASYGIYGPAFELGEHRAREPGSEEYLDSEKYEIRVWDLDRENSLRPLLTRLNQIRRNQPALQSNRGLRFHDTDNPSLLCYSKRDPLGGSVILTVVTVDPAYPQAGHVLLDLDALGVKPDSAFRVRDLLGGQTFDWYGSTNFVALDAAGLAGHVLVVEPSGEPA